MANEVPYWGEAIKRVSANHTQKCVLPTFTAFFSSARGQQGLWAVGLVDALRICRRLKRSGSSRSKRKEVKNLQRESTRADKKKKGAVERKKEMCTLNERGENEKGWKGAG